MLSTTDAIVLSLQPHTDKAHILHAYTRAGGRVNYMVYGLGRRNAIGIYSPLSIVQITASCPPNGLPIVKEANLTSLTSHLSPLTSNPYKQAIALFISEVLFHTLRHPMADEQMFAFLENTIHALAETDDAQLVANHHLFFLIGYAAQLGFAIDEQLNPELLVVPATRAERQQQLRHLCDYLALHVENWQQPRSLDILTEIFD